VRTFHGLSHAVTVMKPAVRELFMHDGAAEFFRQAHQFIE
jgi:hypothetical protein